MTTRKKPADIVEGFPASDDLNAIVKAFKQAHPDAWEELRLCPLQHGLDEMAKRLK